jgi:hypothetical protein
MSDETTFPVDWDEWWQEWSAWRANKSTALAPNRSGYRFPPKNFMADEILGVWEIAGRVVELSEVTFDLGRERSRSVGVTIGDPETGEHHNGGLAHSWRELENLLGV